MRVAFAVTDMEDVAEPLRQHGAQLARRDLAPDGGAGADDEYLQHHMHDGLPERHAAPVHRLLDGRHLLGLRAQQVPYDAGDAQSQRDGGDAADRRHGERAGNELAFDESEHHVFDAVQQQRQQAAQKKSLKEKRQAAQEAKALKAKKAATRTTEAGRVGDRPYARGRSYKEDRYDDQ